MRRDTNPLGEGAIIQICPKKVHEIKKNLGRGGGGVPLGSLNAGITCSPAGFHSSGGLTHEGLMCSKKQFLDKSVTVLIMIQE